MRTRDSARSIYRYMEKEKRRCWYIRSIRIGFCVLHTLLIRYRGCFCINANFLICFRNGGNCFLMRQSLKGDCVKSYIVKAVKFIKSFACVFFAFDFFYLMFKKKSKLKIFSAKDMKPFSLFWVLKKDFMYVSCLNNSVFINGSRHLIIP